MAKTKGWTLIGAVRFLRAQKERAREVLAPELHPYLEKRILESSWYPEVDLPGLLEAVAALIPGPRDQVLAELGAHAAREHLEGIYAHLRLDDRESMWRRAMALWASQHDTGRWDLKATGPGELRMTVKDFAHPSAILCGVNRGYFAEALRLAGYADLSVAKETCLARGDAQCLWRVTYRDPDADA